MNDLEAVVVRPDVDSDWNYKQHSRTLVVEAQGNVRLLCVWKKWGTLWKGKKHILVRIKCKMFGVQCLCVCLFI